MLDKKLLSILLPHYVHKTSDFVVPCCLLYPTLQGLLHQLSNKKQEDYHIIKSFPKLFAESLECFQKPLLEMEHHRFPRGDHKILLLPSSSIFRYRITVPTTPQTIQEDRSLPRISICKQTGYEIFSKPCNLLDLTWSNPSTCSMETM